MSFRGIIREMRRFLTRDYVVIARKQHGESWVAAFDKGTGQICWKSSRNYETAVEGDDAYTTPLVIDHHRKEALLVWGAEHVTAHHPSDSRLVWSCGGFNAQAVPNWPAVASPVIAGDVVVVAGGRADIGRPRLYGIRLGGTGDVTTTHRLWKREDTGTYVSTPAEYKGRIYLLRDRGEVECLDPISGKTLWREVFPKASSRYYTSPLVPGGVLYAIREDGVVFVAGVEGRFEILAENHMVERIKSSPRRLLYQIGC